MPSKRVSLKGKGADLFFGGERAEVLDLEQAELESPPPRQEPPVDTDEATEGPVPSPAEAQDTPRRQRNPRPAAVTNSRDMSPANFSNQASLHSHKRSSLNNGQRASVLASFDIEMIDSIRKVVKVVGRDVSFVRLSVEEKQRLAAIVYTYKTQGVKTSENVINRIAINLLLEDYDANGENSVLARVLAALQA